MNFLPAGKDDYLMDGNDWLKALGVLGAGYLGGRALGMFGGGHKNKVSGEVASAIDPTAGMKETGISFSAGVTPKELTITAPQGKKYDFSKMAPELFKGFGQLMGGGKAPTPAAVTEAPASVAPAATVTQGQSLTPNTAAPGNYQAGIQLAPTVQGYNFMGNFGLPYGQQRFF